MHPQAIVTLLPMVIDERLISRVPPLINVPLPIDIKPVSLSKILSFNKIHSLPIDNEGLFLTTL
ncbi:hypothetical protein D3C87_1712410 [compost metagenome]